jgi:NTP pyrophosphatase (non-canonical NTP hydrolase)
MDARRQPDTAETTKPKRDGRVSLPLQAASIHDLVDECHGRSVLAGWYQNPATGEPLERNVGEMLALIHSEVSEALEGVRKNLNDAHLYHRKSVEVELADALIRICDLAGHLKLDLGGAYHEKLLYNATRADHTLAARAGAEGKTF